MALTISGCIVVSALIASDFLKDCMTIRLAFAQDFSPLFSPL